MAEQQYRFIGGHMDGKQHSVDDGLVSIIMPTYGVGGKGLDYPIYYRDHDGDELVFRLSRSNVLKVKDLIEKLQELPGEAEVLTKTFGDDKIILFAEGHNLDPICQFRLSLLGLKKIDS